MLYLISDGKRRNINLDSFSHVQKMFPECDFSFEFIEGFIKVVCRKKVGYRDIVLSIYSIQSNCNNEEFADACAEIINEIKKTLMEIKNG